jgi:FAD/FMN-containing dehydrogenase
VTIIEPGGGSVGVFGGFFQGGGHSTYTSYWGLAADQILSIEVVTADGRFVTANTTSNPDLFWALRGGGGGELPFLLNHGEGKLNNHRNLWGGHFGNYQSL